MLSFRIMDFYSICEAFTRLKMSPVFETVHFVLMSLNMRKDLLGSGELFFSSLIAADEVFSSDVVSCVLSVGDFSG